MTNKQVAKAFMDGKTAITTHLVSTGDRLLSYGYYEVAKWVDGRIVRRTGANYSQSTACHRGLVYGSNVVLASQETPVSENMMKA